MRGIKYIGSMYDFSGYGNCARKNIISLDDCDYPVIGMNVSFAPNTGLINKKELTRIHEIIDRKIDYDVVLINLTPEFYPRFIEPDKINIAYTMFETSKLHPVWVSPCNKVDAILAPSVWNIGVFRNSGVNVPMDVFPISFDVDRFSNGIEAPEIVKLHDDKLKFYSIFQWSERKNAAAMLRTYLSVFDDTDDVVLILKSYTGNGTTKDRQWLIDEINIIRDSVNTSSYPKLVLLPDLMSNDEVDGLHVGCDVYLGPVRGEGFGIPIMDACLAGNPVIATKYSGHMDFVNEDIHELIDYQLCPVSGMNWIEWYLSDQYWAEPNMEQFGQAMRKIYAMWKGNGYKYENLLNSCKEYSNVLKSKYNPKAVTEGLIKSIDGIKEKLNGQGQIRS